ncbi:hypothetical protein L226DRAFT_352767 [Lentinus tigrinus ALCF2SS1-7]|uniref:uncharacterized protein n=1 Tax=Lentinus tigrinus ALCF2SS1-7 TaxID=1328758 RepID=UPI0011661CD8|nr:hypothetical protein L226DRAFT_352767 [Lentinus tigrinus ALCF2SS1-7]
MLGLSRLFTLPLLQCFFALCITFTLWCVRVPIPPVIREHDGCINYSSRYTHSPLPLLPDLAVALLLDVDELPEGQYGALRLQPLGRAGVALHAVGSGLQCPRMPNTYSRNLLAAVHLRSLSALIHAASASLSTEIRYNNNASVTL